LYPHVKNTVKSDFNDDFLTVKTLKTHFFFLVTQLEKEYI